MLIKEKINKIEFKLFSPELVKKMAVMKIITPELYDADGYPVEGGLTDPRMGVIDPGLRCRTCGGRVKECPGHFGFIELARPVIHLKFVPWIYNFLRCTCSECGRILMKPEDIEKRRAKLKKIEKERGEHTKWDYTSVIARKVKNTKICPHCKSEQKKIKHERPTTFIEEKTRLTPIDIRIRLEKISDEDCELLGLNWTAGRPEWMVLTLLPVPPSTMRPSITLESGQRSEDDLTHKLGDIVRTNQRLFENLNAGAPEVIIEDLWDLLQYHVTTFFSNTVSQLPPARHRSGRPLRTLGQRIRSKEGRFRRNLAGKRVNFSARSVISPDPFLSIDEVGVPLIIAKQLTISEVVTTWNKKWLKEFIERGPKQYPGATYVFTPERKRKKITDETKEAIMEELDAGWVVERHLMNGDIAIFNRQPSLHKMSMMAHYVRILPFKTFRLNLCTTIPYNADFDGDEMNLHIPQTPEARTESELLMNVIDNIITPRYGLPIIGCLQAQITGNFLLTREGELTQKEASQILFSIGIEEPIKTTGISGKELFSILLPKRLNYTGKAKFCAKCQRCRKEKCPYDAYISIKKGKLITGVIDKNSIGAEKGKLLQAILQKYGKEAVKDFIDKVSMLGIQYLQLRGFSTYISDTDLPKEAAKEIRKILDYATKKTDELIAAYKKKKIRRYPGRTLKETLELRIMTTLNRARNKSGAIIKKYSRSRNPTIIMAVSGARGGMLNLAQVSGCVGQQALRGARIEKGYRGRTLPHFMRNDLSPDQHGFIRNGYKSGLNPFEFFFSAITGRDSLMDTSMRTPKSGYMQRRLINALQDLRVFENAVVKDAYGKIVQFKYGEDGMDVSKIIYGEKGG